MAYMSAPHSSLLSVCGRRGPAAAGALRGGRCRVPRGGLPPPHRPHLQPRPPRGARGHQGGRRRQGADDN